jgi:hypothetical protein
MPLDQPCRLFRFVPGKINTKALSLIAGNLFTRDYLLEGITRSQQWLALHDSDIIDLKEKLLKCVQSLLGVHRPNEAQTEKTLIYPVLELLGWNDIEVQQILSSKGRKQVPDALLFANEQARNSAVAEKDHWKRYQHGLAVVEAKRWARALDRRQMASLFSRGAFGLRGLFRDRPRQGARTTRPRA